MVCCRRWFVCWSATCGRCPCWTASLYPVVRRLYSYMRVSRSPPAVLSLWLVGGAEVRMHEWYGLVTAACLRGAHSCAWVAVHRKGHCPVIVPTSVWPDARPSPVMRRGGDCQHSTNVGSGLSTAIPGARQPVSRPQPPARKRSRGPACGPGAGRNRSDVWPARPRTRGHRSVPQIWLMLDAHGTISETCRRQSWKHQPSGGHCPPFSEIGIPPSPSISSSLRQTPVH